MPKKTLIIIGKIFIFWRIALFFIGAFADQFLKYVPSFPYSEIMLQPSGLPRWMYSWGNFDGVHYVTIADLGYVGTGLVQAFFPFYPYILLHLPKLIIPHFPIVAAGLVISNLAALLLTIVFFALAKLYFGKRAAWFSLAALFLFPTAFFFGAMYTESLFLLLVVSSFYSAAKQKWWLAGVIAAIASGTRLVGICLVPALLIELYLQARSAGNAKSFHTFLHTYWQQLLAISVCGIGLFSYMSFLYGEYADPLYFLHVQAEFGAGRNEQLILYPQVAWRSIKILLTAPVNLSYGTYLQEAVAGIAGLAGILWSARKVRLSIVTFSLLAFLIPTFTGTFSSMSRYILVCLSIWLALGEYFGKRSKLAWLWLITSTILLIFNTILFIQGYWVA